MNKQLLHLRLLVTLFFCTGIGATLHAQTIFYVDAAATGANNGNSWSNAYNYLSAALTAANAGTGSYEIWVAQGTYYPTGAQSGTNRDNSFIIAQGSIKVYGGYPQGGGTRNVTANTTILNGDIGTAGSNTDNSYHVMTVVGMSAAADSIVVDGFTIENGNASGLGSYTYNGIAVNQNNGAGIITYSNNSNPKILFQNLTFTGGHSSNDGGGISSRQASAPCIQHCTFRNNTSVFGAGVANTDGSTAVINNCFFVNNTATTYAGGVYSLSTSAPMVYNSVFSGNSAGTRGGAIYCSGAGATVTNCTITGNTAPTNGAGGIYSAASTLTVKNSIIYGNTTINLNTATGTVVITYSDVQGGVSGTGNINPDPLFVAPGNALGADGLAATPDDGLKLTCGSDALYAGNTNTLPILQTDILGNPRSSTPTMGAYERADLTTSHPAPATYSDTRNEQATTQYGRCDSVIASITANGTAPIAGSTMATVYLQSTAPSTTNGTPYVRRYFDITPATGANTATANITLYFTQADFDDYNAHRGAFPSLPVDAADAANNKANLNISQQHGTSATGNPGSYTGWAGSGPANILITPTTVAWNSTATRWEVTFPVTGFSGFFASTGNNTPLAVNLTGVTATNEGRHNRIDWTTKTEQEGDYFEVERSLNANSYQKIGTVTGRQVQGGGYTLMDEAPATGVNYYRIKIMGATGTAQYSKNVSATVAQGSFVLEAYPNPATNRITIRITGTTGTNATVSILDASGKAVSQTPITGAETVLSLEGFAPGLYLLEYRDNNRVQHIKVQKQ